MRITIIILFFSIGLNAQVFDGAVGFGADWTFPFNDAEYINVTSGANSGAGTLRDAVERSSSNSARIITFYGFDGYITTSSNIDIIHDNTYIAAQTSNIPIVIRSNGSNNNALLRVQASNVIVRGMGFRRGPGPNNEVNGDCVTLLSGSNIIFDHCEFSWATDEIINVYGTSNHITFQNCIASEALYYSSHAYTTDPNNSAYYRGHSMGCLIGDNADYVSFDTFLFHSNNQRNPLIGGDAVGGTRFEFNDVVVSNWGQFGMDLGSDAGMRINIQNLVSLEGPNSSTSRYGILLDEADNILVYVDDVYSNEGTDMSAIANGVAPYNDPVDPSVEVGVPYNYPLANSPSKTKGEIIQHVVDNAGMFNPDAVSLRIKDEVIRLQGTIIDDPSDVGGWPPISGGAASPTDTDNDGIPDSEEGNYSNLFDYVNALAGDIEEAPKPAIPVEGSVQLQVNYTTLLD